ncbi:hydrogenase maturation protease [Aquabacterium sp. A7-Y]|uniref:hydrogenase maturation protease n=1 Tax=Aquabacterium sp. A7-Y TaxID=1349605 RepID=UPI00223E2801|nr:hydrogenase maturation protease [Aquabacterium sp. A7-Y]MCW7541117.1 hydrogenase maturation protease [Aquabacterium sp. A7-Y]
MTAPWHVPGGGAGAPREPGPARVRVIGYGNPGRQDDGLGPAAAAAVAGWQIPGVAVSNNYQLVVEDALELSTADVVWFVDADRTGPGPYHLARVAPDGEASFTSHLLSPHAVLALCERYWGRSPEAWLMGIRGYRFDLGEGLGSAAQANLSQALVCLRRGLVVGSGEAP